MKAMPPAPKKIISRSGTQPPLPLALSCKPSSTAAAARPAGGRGLLPAGTAAASAADAAATCTGSCRPTVTASASPAALFPLPAAQREAVNAMHDCACAAPPVHACSAAAETSRELPRAASSAALTSRHCLKASTTGSAATPLPCAKPRDAAAAAVRAGAAAAAAALALSSSRPRALAATVRPGAADSTGARTIAAVLESLCIRASAAPPDEASCGNAAARTHCAPESPLPCPSDTCSMATWPERVATHTGNAAPAAADALKEDDAHASSTAPGVIMMADTMSLGLPTDNCVPVALARGPAADASALPTSAAAVGVSSPSRRPTGHTVGLNAALDIM